MRALCLVPLLLVAAGCWQPRYFMPRENRNGTSPEGDSAAVYKVSVEGDAEVQGEVRVWSNGARARYAEDDSEVVDLHVGFELENTGRKPLTLDLPALRCEDLVVDGRAAAQLALHSSQGSGVAPPGSTARVDVMFRPATSRPSDVDAFSVRFGVRSGADPVVEQVTPFTPARSAGRGYYGGVWGGPWVGPWGYGPGWYGGWGPGWYTGFGWGYGIGFRGRCR